MQRSPRAPRPHPRRSGHTPTSAATTPGRCSDRRRRCRCRRRHEGAEHEVSATRFLFLLPSVHPSFACACGSENPFHGLCSFPRPALKLRHCPWTGKKSAETYDCVGEGERFFFSLRWTKSERAGHCGEVTVLARQGITFLLFCFCFLVGVTDGKCAQDVVSCDCNCVYSYLLFIYLFFLIKKIIIK